MPDCGHAEIAHLHGPTWKRSNSRGFVSLGVLRISGRCGVRAENVGRFWWTFLAFYLTCADVLQDSTHNRYRYSFLSPFLRMAASKQNSTWYFRKLSFNFSGDFIVYWLLSQSIATASLFLAGKVEETPKPLREVVRISYLVQFKNDHERAAKEIFQKVLVSTYHTCCACFVRIFSCSLQDCYLERQDDILEAERIILHTLGFEFNVEHPYRHLLNAVKRVTRAQTVNESLSRGLAQVAWNFANDRSE